MCELDPSEFCPEARLAIALGKDWRMTLSVQEPSGVPMLIVDVDNWAVCFFGAN